MQNMIRTTVFDFGGVIADEGFYEGLMAIARMNGLEPVAFFTTVEAIIHETGYLIGRAEESVFWDTVRKRTGLSAGNSVLRREIISRFILRPTMIRAVDVLRSRSIEVVMLSDQTNWLDEIDQQTGLSSHFDRVFNSYHIHQSKRDAGVFRFLCSELKANPSESLFVDDNAGHISRARESGLLTIHFTTMDTFLKEMKGYFPWYQVVSGS